jgi:hypothetical protein
MIKLKTKKDVSQPWPTRQTHYLGYESEIISYKGKKRKS